MSHPVQLIIESAQGTRTLVIPPAQQQLRLTDLLRQKHLPLNTRCGQRSLCDGCVIELRAGHLVRTTTGQILEPGADGLSVRGCEYRLGDAATVRIQIPPRSLLAYEPQVVSNFKINIPRAHDPLWQQLAIPCQEIHHDGADAEYLCQAVTGRAKRRRPVRIDPEIAARVALLCADRRRATSLGEGLLTPHSAGPQVSLATSLGGTPSPASVPSGSTARTARTRSLPTTRETPSDATLYATIEYREDHWLITDVAADPGPPALGVAIDIGTTTVAVLLVDLTDGRILGQAANFNRQMHLGDDVLTRINLCATDPAMTGHLQELIVRGTIAPLLTEALQKAAARADQVRCLAVAGNTTMLHLFAGVDPTPMGMAPFPPVFLAHRVLSAQSIHLPVTVAAPTAVAPATEPAAPTPIPPTAIDPTIHLLPGAAAYVGADLTAGAFATGLVYDEGPNLLVDVGTNGEIILKRGEHLFGCATAAGPAFEGAGLTNGVRAAEGAIGHIGFATDPFAVKTEVIGHRPPIGLCGTAYIDFLAEGRRIGLLTKTGRFDKTAVAGSADRFVPWQEYGLGFRVATGQGKTNILVTETDVARLLQAKAAIAAGILTLLERLHLTPSQVERLYLAGGFGLHLNATNAIRCGLLPGFTEQQIQVVGNTSLGGAYLALLDCGALDEIARAGQRMEVIELNLDPGFENRYIDQLSLP